MAKIERIHTGNLEIRNAADAEKYKNITKVTGYLYINSSAKLDALTSVGGDLSINSSAKLDALTCVGGDLYIYSSAKLDALTSVGGYLYINSSAKLDALTSVGGYLYINSSAKLDALALTSVGGYLYINSSAKLDALTSVGGALYIYSSAKLDALTSVGGDLYIYSSAKLDALALTSVGGDLSINSSAKLDALALTSVGGDLSINSSAKLDALTSVGGALYIYKKDSLTANKLYCGGYDKFTVLDNIGCVVLSSKQSNGVTVLMCRHSKIKNQKVIGEKFCVAQKDGYNAHGKTVAEATQELMFKIGPRDVERFRNMPLTTVKSPADWAVIYRTITGACQYGTNKFIESKGKLKKRYTLSEIVSMTKGQWGHKRFVAVVKPKMAKAA